MYTKSTIFNWNFFLLINFFNDKQKYFYLLLLAMWKVFFIYRAMRELSLQIILLSNDWGIFIFYTLEDIRSVEFLAVVGPKHLVVMASFNDHQVPLLHPLSLVGSPAIHLLRLSSLIDFTTTTTTHMPSPSPC